MRILNVEHLQVKRESLRKQYQDLGEQMELVDNEIESAKASEFLEILPGTTWKYTNSGMKELQYVSQPERLSPRISDVKLETVVFKTLELYPHGSLMVSPSIKLIVSDWIILRPEPLASQYSKKDPYKELIIAFIKEYKLVIKFDHLEKAFKHDLRMAQEGLEGLEELKKEFSL